MKLLCLFAVLCALRVQAYPTGAGVCLVTETVIGNMPEVVSPGGAGGFTITLSRTTNYSPSSSDNSPSNVIVTISGPTFNGFLLYAERNTGAKHGTWTTPSGSTTAGSLPGACTGIGNTLTHSTTTTKGGTGTPFLSTWTAPIQAVGGSITFKALIMVAGSPRNLFSITSASLTEQITAPLVPRNIVVSPRWKCVVVRFDMDDGGSAVTFIDVRSTASPGARANGTASPITICGLPNGQATTITVAARNAIGQGPTGTSASVTPACFCNGHSTTCDAGTGFCTTCTGNTMGNYCETCQAGYTGDPTLEQCSVIVPPGPRGAAARLDSSVAILFSIFLWALCQLWRL
jgi:hypothetical protein